MEILLNLKIVHLQHARIGNTIHKSCSDFILCLILLYMWALLSHILAAYIACSSLKMTKQGIFRSKKLSYDKRVCEL